MNADQKKALKGLVTTLLPLIPGVGPWAKSLIGLEPTIRDLFARAGGDESDFDELMADTRAGIDMLANPDRFRHRGPDDRDE